MPAATAAVQLLVRLPDPAEDDAFRLEAGGEGAGQLAAGDDVGAGAQIAQDAEHGEVGVRLHRVRDPVRHRREGLRRAPRNWPPDRRRRCRRRPACPTRVRDGSRARRRRGSSDPPRRSSPASAESRRIGRCRRPAVSTLSPTPPPSRSAFRTTCRSSALRRAELLVGQHPDRGLGLLLDLGLARRAPAETGVDEAAAVPPCERGTAPWSRPGCCWPRGVPVPSPAGRAASRSMLAGQRGGQARQRQALLLAAGAASEHDRAGRPRRAARSPAGAGRRCSPTRSTWRRASCPRARRGGPGCPAAASSFRTRSAASSTAAALLVASCRSARSPPGTAPAAADRPARRRRRGS